MKMYHSIFILFILISVLSLPGFGASVLSSLETKKLDEVTEQIKELAQNTELISELAHLNKMDRLDYKSMTNEKWKSLSVRSPLVKTLLDSKVGQILKSKRKPFMTEMFVSLADGTKAGFIEKPSNWNHKGKDKHEIPMKGQVWRGPLEFDESAGTNQVQIGVPIQLDGSVIGSIVVGVAIAKL